MRRRLLASLLGGALLGGAVALLLRVAIDRTATPLSPERALWQLILLIVAGALSGFAISSVSALQAASRDPDYHRPRHPLRPNGRRQPPG
ncbi:MAG: hypothetical protein VKI83_03700 [Synechococcaceae cyanobacterium]|nr:hypothetical protein [Synechococcaceae cyanobacterium]